MRQLFAVFLSLGVLFTIAQEAEKPTLGSKLDWQTHNAILSKQYTEAFIQLLVQGDPTAIEDLTKSLGGVYKYAHGNINSVTIPSGKAIDFANHSAVERIENSWVRGVPLMDSARINNNINNIHAGLVPLTQPYTGKGVVVGIIDGGIYWEHPDFKNPDGSSRIRYIWDQQVTNPTYKPLPYDYGQEWSWIDINANKCTHIPKYLDGEYGHGTCVAGIAAGNGRSLSYDTMRYRGIAYDADIIAVRVPLVAANSFLAYVADAVDYIYKKADALGKPCVINTSVGTYYGSHDGKDFATRIIDSLIQQKKGRVLVAAGGNAGHIPHHVRHEVNGDSAVSYFRYWSGLGGVYYEFWGDSTDVENLEFVVGATSTKTGNIIDTAQTERLNVLRDFNPTTSFVKLTRNLYVNGGTQLIGSVDLYAEKQGQAYRFGVDIIPVDQNVWWKLQTFGSGKIDLWSDSTGILSTSPIVRTLPNLIIKSDFVASDTLYTMVSSWQNSDKVITVANYANRAGYLDIDSIYRNLTISDGDMPGKQYRTSSFGPTRDDRFKPDISATGSTTLCTGDLRLVNGTTGYPGYVGNANRSKVALGGKHIRNGGTSMASPMVAGVAALYLEKRPTARWDEIKQALINSAKRDSFTGSDANFAYGHGKLNAYNAMIEQFVYGCMDTGSLNYQPTATLDTGGCVKKVYGCTDAGALNYLPAANVNNGSCVYETSIEKTPAAKKIGVRTYPNPFANETYFAIDGLPQSFNNAEIVVNDMIGRTEDKINVTKGVYQYRFANNSLPSGVHLYKLVVDGKTLYTGKVIKY